MARPNPFINRFRYAILTVLIVVTIGYSWYLYRLYFQPPPPAAEQAPSIAVTVLAEGSVVIDGVTYSTPETLRPKLVQIEQAHPGAGYSINARSGQDFSGIAKAVVLLQKSGAKTVWVINEQKKP